MTRNSQIRLTVSAIVVTFWVIACLWVATPAQAQMSGATLSGVVRDQTGGVIPNASVSIRNQGTGIARDVQTNSAGLYSAPNLLPATYDVTVTAPGFSTTVQKGIVLTVGDQQALNFTMKVGAITQTVEVTEEVPLIQSQNATLSAVVDQKTVVDLPLNSRDWTQLATLQLGVISIRTQRATIAISATKCRVASGTN